MRVAALRRPNDQAGVILLSAALSAALSVVYLLWEPQTLDLAAQTFRADLWDRYGWVLYNDAWYSGHLIPGYSLLYPPLGAWLGPALLGAICAVSAAATFAAIAVRAYGSRAWVGALWFGLGSTVALFGGRITFALGLALALAAALALQRRRPALAALAALAAGLASPVAGLFTALAAAAVLIAARLEPIATPSRAALTRTAWVTAAAATIATVALTLAFPTPGYQPFTAGSFLWIPVVCAVCFVLLPVGETTLRCGIVLYALVAIAAFTLTTPFGGNAIRLGATFAGPVMALALYGRRPIALLLIAAPLLWWQWTATVRDVAAAEGEPSTRAAFFEPLVAELEGLADGSPIRVEIPPTRSRWESVYVAERIPLARGWLRQLESDDFDRFTYGNLTAAGYANWLREHGVDYVALGDAPLDYLALDEAALVESGTLGYLSPVWSNQDWSVWRVGLRDDGAVPLDTVGPDSFSLSVPGAGRYPIGMRYSPYLEIVEGEGCLEPSGEHSTVLTVPPGAGPQTIEVHAALSLGGLLRREPICTERGLRVAPAHGSAAVWPEPAVSSSPSSRSSSAMVSAGSRCRRAVIPTASAPATFSRRSSTNRQAAGGTPIRSAPSS